MFRTIARPAGPWTLPRWRPPGRLQAYWTITAASLACFVLSHVVEGASAIGLLLTIGGCAGCGWSWLLTRALFDPAEHDARWPRAVVLLIFGTGILTVLAGASESLLLQVIGNAQSLASSAVLLLTFVEPLHGYRRDLPLAEKRFRLIFVAGYAALVGISILMLRAPGADLAEIARAGVIKSACAVAALMLGAGAVWFRTRHPLARPDRRTPPQRPAATPDELQLGDRILRLLRDEEIYTAPQLKVADIARKVGEPEYKVSQCITAALGFANFNRLVNHHRIARAKEMLGDPDQRDQPILLVALDCGFASIGPFNRAFKEETGLTPRAFRAARLDGPFGTPRG